MLKKNIRKLLELFGIEVRRKPKYAKVLNYDDIYKSKINNVEPIILDVGANRGQSIERFMKIFQSPKIFAFEPNPEVFNETFQKYKIR